jgi:hypothetical protein
LLQRIKLHLARTPEYPEGSPSRGYEIIAPLDAQGHLDARAWHAERARCEVRRFWTGEPDRFGRLMHRPGGSGGATWTFDYGDRVGADAEEEGHHLNTHRFLEGEYVSIREHGGEPIPFKVESVGQA